MKLTKLYILLLLGSMWITGCSQENVEASQVTIYEIAGYRTQGDQCSVEMASIEKGGVLVANDDILAYYQRTHEIELTEASKRRLVETGDHKPFLVMVGKTPVYAGFIKPGISSSICFESVTLDWALRGSVVKLNLGYPNSAFFTQFDPRNAEILINALNKQGKLK